MEAKAFRKRKTVLASDFLCGGGNASHLEGARIRGRLFFCAGGLAGTGHGGVLL